MMKYSWLLIVLLLTACSATKAEETAVQKQVTVGFLMDTLNEERWVKDRAYFTEEVQKQGANIQVAVAHGNDALQIEQAEKMIRSHVDILVIVPHNAQAMAAIVHQAHKANIQVIAYDRIVKNADIDLYISFDNERVGQLQAEELLKSVPQGNVVYIGGASTDHNSHLLKKGAMNVLAPLIRSGDIRIQYDQWTKNWQPKEAAKGMEEALRINHHQIDAVIAAKIRENIRLMQPYGAMYAAGNHTGIQRSTVPFLFSGDFSKTYPGWGLTHEIGHRMAVGMREYGEVTNNMVSMAMSVEYNALDNRIPYETIYKHVIKENQKSMTAQGLSERLGAFWQLELAHPGYWAELNKLYREQPVSLPEGDYSKQQYLIQYSSEVLEKDLSSYFARHGFTVGDDTKEKTSIYEAPTKIWYLNNSVISYKGHGFTEDAQPQVVHTTQPELSIEHHVTIPVNSAFTPSDYVTAKNSAGDTITDKVSITSNVDTKVPGDYTVTFELPPLSRSSNVA